MTKLHQLLFVVATISISSRSLVAGVELPVAVSARLTAGATIDDDLVKIDESQRPVKCSGVRQADLAPESQIVAIRLVGQQQQQSSLLMRHANQNVLSSSSQPGKQSQEFEIGNSQQANTTATPPPAQPSTNEVTDQNTSSVGCNNKPPVVESTTTTVATPAATSTTGTSDIVIVGESSTTTTTTVAPPEPNIVIETPVGTKTTRQGDAVYCGEANPNGKSNKRLVLDRIVGGRKTEPGEFPFQVRLNIRSRRGSGICGGVILDRYHILTAAHCMTACASQYLTTATIETSGVHATIGDHSIKSNDGEIEIDVDKITPHEKYDACNFYANDHDIALIKTSSPIEYRFTTDGYGSINRPCMPQDTEVNYREGESVIVSGWGVTRENSGSLSNILRYVQVPIVNITKCQETYGSRVTKDHVCAGYQSGGKDSCQGDSGGPLVRVVDNRYELVGIVSFGYGCGQPGAPGVYTRVASYIDWIKANLSTN